MTSNVKAFQKELNKMKKAIKREVTLSIQNVVEQIFVELRSSPPIGTPVKTGWARAGWRISLNTPLYGPVNNKGSVSTENTKAKNSLKTFMNRKTLSNISNIFITNRVSYIELLNNGEHSKQSPKLFIELATQRGMALAKKKRRVRI